MTQVAEIGQEEGRQDKGSSAQRLQKLVSYPADFPDTLGQPQTEEVR